MPAFVLRIDNWNDYGHVIQFHLYYHETAFKKTYIGPIKILEKKNKDENSLLVNDITHLNTSFSKLGAEYISLGQEDDYYTNLRALCGEQTSEVLIALRDIAWQPALAIELEPTSAFRNALMRSNGAQRARRFGRAWATGESVNEDPSFSYIGSIEGADADVDASFDFQSDDPIPGRIVGIIGRNAVGKTRFLASLGADLAQISRTSAERLKERELRFPSGRPLFTRIIAISYSAFDRFKRPISDSSSSYVYCGIRNDKGGLSRAYLNKTYRTNQDRIRTQGLQSEWIEYAQTILGDLSNQLMSNLKSEIESPIDDDQALSLLSSGQSILVHFVTALLAWIQPNSLVLFDEPETHLHPNAVASLFLVLSKILQNFDSYAVVATHSPVVIQEIPAKRVLVFQREQNITTVQPLLLESFGASVTELTKHVFETIEVESVYRKTLKKLAKQESAIEVLARFDQGLSLNAEAYLIAQYGKRIKSK